MKCSCCGKLLNEFDIAFHKNFKFKKDYRCACITCNIGDSAMKTLFKEKKRMKEEKKRRRIFKILIPSYILLWLSFFGAVLGIDLFGIVYVIGYWVLNSLAVSTLTIDPGTTETFATGEHYESTFNNDGSVTTRKVQETSSSTVGRRGPGIFGKISAFITAPLWFVFYCLYQLIFCNEYTESYKYIKKELDEEIADAFVKALKEVPKTS